MNKTFIIIMREYLSRVKKRSFLILTLITPILIAAFYVAIVWVMFSSDDKLRMIAVNNQSSLKSPLENTTNIHFKYIDNIDLESAKKEFLGGDNFYALLDIPANIMEEQKVNIYSQKQVNMSVSNELRRQLSEKIEDLKFEKIIAQTQIADLAKATQSGGSKVVGIISQQIYDMGVVYENLDELIITKDIRERKALLAKKADAFIVLPGGFGTLEEATEVINDKLFGNHNKPILFINTNNYYKDLIQHFNLYKKEGFSRFENENVFFFVENAYLAMKKLSPNKLC